MSREVCQLAQDLIRKWEGFQLAVYKDQAGLLTVGWGHRTTLPLGAIITEEQAESMFAYDIGVVSACIAYACNNTLLNDNQFGALVSFVFNIGMGDFTLPKQGGSQVLKALRTEKFDEVPALMKAWIHITLPSGTKVESAGLANRRAAECVLYETPPDQSQLNFEGTS